MGRAVQVEFLVAGITDASGLPLSGGKVFCYEAGTMTLKSVFTDQAQAVASTNPVILSTRGTALIFAEGAYKFIVKNSADVIQFTIDGMQYVYPDNFNIYTGTSSGSANAYVLSPSPASTSYVDGATYTFVANHATTSTSTLNISGLGSRAFVRNDGTTNLTTGDILVNMLVNAQYILASNHFRLVSAAGVLALSGGGSGASTAAGARTNFGLGTIATQAANAVTITGGAVTGITDITVADGGTGASDAGTARTNLGLGTIATQASNSVTITGGAISGATLNGSLTSSSVAITGGAVTGITDITVADGGTGASSAATARTNLGAAAAGANSDITSLGGATSVISATDLTLGAGAANKVSLIVGGSAKVEVPTGTTSGSVGMGPSIDNWYNLGGPSNFWQTVHTVGVLGRTGSALVLASNTSQNIQMHPGNGLVTWTFTSAGKLVWASAPAYTLFAYTVRRSLNPAIATTQQCADSINTIMSDLKDAGIFG